MTIRHALITTAALTATLALPLLGQEPAPQYVGQTDKGFLLPNGWKLSPAGDQVVLTDLPLNIVPLADGTRALVASSGFNAHELAVVDLASKQVSHKQTARQSWFGLAVDEARGKVWWSGGGSKMIHAYDLKDGTLTQTSEAEPAPEPRAKNKRSAADRAKAKAKASDAAPEVASTGPAAKFKSGLTLDTRRNRLYSLDVSLGLLNVIDPTTNELKKTVSVGGRPYDVAVPRGGSWIYVSDWAGRAVLALDAETLNVVAKISVGEHPNQIVLHPKDERLFVACASTNNVSVIDTKRGVVTETIMTTLFPLAPEGSTPDALAVSPDGQTLYVANADNNCVAVVDISKPRRAQVKGFVPTGWYPTSVAITPDGKTLLIGVGKGNQTKPNPPSEHWDRRVAEALKNGEITEELRAALRFPYIGATLSGALSIVPVPDDKQLAAYTETVYKNCPYSDTLLTNAPSTRKTAIPTKVGDPSPIKYVLYIIKENRTYDQVFGDIKRGNGDPSLVLFGEQVTPNHHKLANEYVLLDNLYCNGHVSADGHPWSTMAYNTDYIARNWALTYSRRAGVDDDDDGDLAKAPSGYLWDSCARAGLTYRSYGEYGRRVSQPDRSFKMEGAVPGLVGHFCSNWGVPKAEGVPVRDTDRVETFLEEFNDYVAKGTLPRFMVMSLGEDHTTGTTPGTFTPHACVASNDLALGRLVDAVTRSKVWPETAIFVIEDDAQNGPDHVDAHRTIGLVISPYARRNHLDSTQYQTVSMIRTMELILGLPPLSQFDAAANPMFGSFTNEADLHPYTFEKARINLNAKNSQLAYGAERSLKMDFAEYDRVDDFELNEILWWSIKGADAPLPPAVRRAIASRNPTR
jgi:YVTN family beta-propeller protein